MLLFLIASALHQCYASAMVQYETYQANAVEAPGLRRWLIGGLVLSLCLHAGLLAFFYRHQVSGFGSASERLAPPRVVNMKRVSIPESLVPEQKAVITEKPQGKAEITLPTDRPEVKEISMAPQTPEMPKPVVAEKPKVDMAGLDKMVKSDAASRAEMDKELANIAQALIKESPRAPRQPALALGSGSGAGGGAGTDNVKIPGLDTIDEKLAKFGSLHAGERAGMPGGALFEYDSYELREEAVGQLRKLGQLIDKNPRATFTIEGHSDSFGPPDYNLKLSEDRADSVKNWLVQFYHIAPERIQTRGFGNTKPLVSADKSKEEQAPNRRVELVVRTNSVRK